MRSANSALKRVIAVVVLTAAAVFSTAGPASALDEPRVPENVGQYFATGLIPRLVDLFGAAAGAEVVFDATAKVGGIHRVLSFTKAYLSGAKTDDPTQITNTWIAPITAADGTVAGVATVWINPASDQPELSDFSSGPTLATALATAPKGTLLIRDDAHSAWFATDGSTLTPLVSGSSGVSAATTPVAYQRQFTLVAPVAADPGPNRGLLIAIIVLGIVVVLLAAFVLLPDRRRRARVAPTSAGEGTRAAALATPEPVAVVTEVEPAPMAAPPVKPRVSKPAPATPELAKPAAVKPVAPKAPAGKSAVPKTAPARSAGPKPTAAKPAAAKAAAAKLSTPKASAPKRAPVKPKADPTTPA